MLEVGDLATVSSSTKAGFSDVAQVRADSVRGQRELLFNAKIGEIAPAGLSLQGYPIGGRVRIVKDITFATAGKLVPGDLATITAVPGSRTGDVAQLRADPVRNQQHIIFGATADEIELLPAAPLAKGDRVRLLKQIAFATAGQLETGDAGTVVVAPGGDAGLVKADGVRGQQPISFAPRPGEVELEGLHRPLEVGQLVRLCRPIQFAKAGRLAVGDFACVLQVPGKAADEVAQVSAGAVRGQDRILFGARIGETVPVTADWLADAPLHHLRAALSSAASSAPSTRFRRSWSIDECLHQHEALQKQVETVRQKGNDRVYICRLILVRTLGALSSEREIVSDGVNAKTLASEQECAVMDALRALRQESTASRQHLLAASEDRDKAAKEAADMKQVVDDHKAECPKSITERISSNTRRKHFYCSDCKVGGHGKRFCEYLLKRPEWRCYPHHKWGPEKERQPWCPLGMRMVDFCDETFFSHIAMYLRGRIWIEDKAKLYQLVPEIMPKTWNVAKKQWFVDPGAPPSDLGHPHCWFLKESDRNFGSSIFIGKTAEECLQAADPTCVYVVQQHIERPLLIEGCKFHVRAYILLVAQDDGVSWDLYTYRDGYLSISPVPWKLEDRTTEAQVTTRRNRRCIGWEHWDRVYQEYRQQMELATRRAVERRRLEGELHRRQFEVVAADVMVDEDMRCWLIEFNVSPSLKDPIGSAVGDDALVSTHELDDSALITAALQIAIPPATPAADDGMWDHVCRIDGPPPLSPQQAAAGDAAAAAGILVAAAHVAERRQPPAAAAHVAECAAEAAFTAACLCICAAAYASHSHASPPHRTLEPKAATFGGGAQFMHVEEVEG
eukprot:TRINITY_DN2283_c0_g1_i7.p1 TRINITY_DN2283_c0_g1~~TRINITY_DN2283_c0_g1_i7.p1  ORF type:complete len:913 (+),score=198.15 TRINITY_DN2283_c0_g1_i7:202-2739(+)